MLTFITVARPSDWTGTLTHFATIGVGLLLAIPILLARLPSAWIGLADGRPWLVRFALLAGAGLLLLRGRPWIFARLPAAPYLVWRTIVFAERGRRRRVQVAKVTEIFVELRPPGLTQVFMLELDDGTTHELCPVDWAGAGRLYAAISRQLKNRAGSRSGATRIGL